MKLYVYRIFLKSIFLKCLLWIKIFVIWKNLNYANKYYSDSKNRKAWVDKFHDEAVKKGMILGNGTAIHAHGTTNELRNKMPKPFKIVLPKNFKGI